LLFSIVVVSTKFAAMPEITTVSPGGAGTFSPVSATGVDKPASIFPA